LSDQRRRRRCGRRFLRTACLDMPAGVALDASRQPFVGQCSNLATGRPVCFRKSSIEPRSILIMISSSVFRSTSEQCS
jgi:hypothetical protein